jgi:hypothetical protein
LAAGNKTILPVVEGAGTTESVFLCTGSGCYVRNDMQRTEQGKEK